MNYDGKVIKLEISVDEARELLRGTIPENLLTQLNTPWCKNCGEVAPYDDPSSCPCGSTQFAQFKVKQ